MIGLYAQLGYETLVTSVADGRGLGRLAEVLARGLTALSGQSGVGKSSLLNALQPRPQSAGRRDELLDVQG